MKFRAAGCPGEFDVELTEGNHGFVRARINGEEHIVTVLQPTSSGDEIIRIGRRLMRLSAARLHGSILVTAGPVQFEFFPVEGRSTRRRHGLVTPEIMAPMPGKVVKLPVTEGQLVEAGDVLVVLEAMKMETALHAESPAVVKHIPVAVGQMVDHGAILLVLSPATSPLTGGADSPAQ